MVAAPFCFVNVKSLFKSTVVLIFVLIGVPTNWTFSAHVVSFPQLTVLLILKFPDCAESRDTCISK